jgi:hypothetical protein
LASKLQSQDFSLVIGSLKTLNMVMKKYRSEFESNRVLTELKFILENFQDIHIEFFKVRTKGGGGVEPGHTPPPASLWEKNSVSKKNVWEKQRSCHENTVFLPPVLAVFETFGLTRCSLSASKLKHSPPMNKP